MTQYPTFNYLEAFLRSIPKVTSDPRNSYAITGSYHPAGEDAIQKTFLMKYVVEVYPNGQSGQQKREPISELVVRSVFDIDDLEHPERVITETLDYIAKRLPPHLVAIREGSSLKLENRIQLIAQPIPDSRK